MATSVLLACGLNEQRFPKYTFLREDTNVDGSFLISCILGQRLKIQNTSTLLLCLHHTYQHYSNAGIRLGFNLGAAIDKGNLHVIEPLNDLAENLFESTYLHASQETLLNVLWQKLESQITEILSKKKSLTIIIDDLSTLINLGASELMVLQFCRQLLNTATKVDAAHEISIVTKLNTANLYEHLCSNLEDLADTEIQINKLKSGNFKEVDGRLIVIKANARNTPKSMLYKVNERNVKIFAPGEVGIKI